MGLARGHVCQHPGSFVLCVWRMIPSQQLNHLRDDTRAEKEMNVNPTKGRREGEGLWVSLIAVQNTHSRTNGTQQTLTISEATYLMVAWIGRVLLFARCFRSWTTASNCSAGWLSSMMVGASCMMAWPTSVCSNCCTSCSNCSMSRCFIAFCNLFSFRSDTVSSRRLRCCCRALPLFLKSATRSDIVCVFCCFVSALLEARQCNRGTGKGGEEGEGENRANTHTQLRGGGGGERCTSHTHAPHTHISHTHLTHRYQRKKEGHSSCLLAGGFLSSLFFFFCLFLSFLCCVFTLTSFVRAIGGTFHTRGKVSSLAGLVVCLVFFFFCFCSFGLWFSLISSLLFAERGLDRFFCANPFHTGPPFTRRRSINGNHCKLAQSAQFRCIIQWFSELLSFIETVCLF